MSPLRGIIALAIVAVAAVTIFLLRDDGQNGDAGPNTGLALADVAKETAAGRERSVPEAASGPATSGTTRTEALTESLAPPEGGAAQGAASTKWYAVSGTVQDEHGRPVAGAPVSLNHVLGSDFVLIDGSALPGEAAQSAQTEANGRFRFARVAADDRLRVRVTPERHTAAEASLPDRRTGDIDLGILSVGAGATLIGHVVGTAGQPVPDAEVRAWTKQDRGSNSPGMIIFGDVAPIDARTATTDDSGFFSISGLNPGAIHALVQAEGFTSESVRGIMLEKGATSEDVTITVSEGASIQGVVVDASGSPLAGAEVAVMETVIDLSEGGMVGELGKNLSTRSDADGTFRLAGLRSSTYNVTASKKGFLREKVSGVEAGADNLRLSLGRSGVLFGYVRNRVSTEPISEFEVSIRGKHDISFGDVFQIVGGDGEVLRGDAAAALAGVAAAPELFAISGFSSRDITLRVTADGFAEYEYGPVQVDTGSKVECQVQMVPEITVSGLVIDAHGEPVGGAAVSLRKEAAGGLFGMGGARIERRVRMSPGGGAPTVEDGSQSYSDISDLNGTFKLRGIAPGEYSLSATHSEWAPSESATMDLVEGDQTEDLEVALRAGGALSGVTYDADGNLLAEARVSLNPVAQGGAEDSLAISMGVGGGFVGGSDKSTISDQEGKYRLGGILPGRYMVELHNPHQATGGAMMFMMSNDGGAQKGTAVSIEEGETAVVDLHLPPTGTVTGQVTEAGNPLSGISVSLKDPNTPFPMGGPSSRTDDSGKFTMRNVEPGEYTLTVSPGGAPRPIERDIKVRARETTNEQVTLPTGVVAGRVTDAGTGRPLAGIVINVDPARAEGETAPPRERRAMQVVMVTADSSGGSGDVTTMKFGNEPDSVVTDSNGYYEVRYVSPGDYVVSISGAGIEKMKRDRVRVFEGQRAEGIDFKAVSGATLIIRPDGGSSDPLHFFRAKLTNQATGETDERMEAGNPSLRIEGLAAGSYLVEITANDKSGELLVEIGSGEEKEVTIPIR